MGQERLNDESTLDEAAEGRKRLTPELNRLRLFGLRKHPLSRLFHKVMDLVKKRSELNYFLNNGRTKSVRLICQHICRMVGY